MTDKQRADTYAAFLNRLYIYRNITLDNARIQKWLSKLDDWGRAAGDQFVIGEEWDEVMAELAAPEPLD